MWLNHFWIMSIEKWSANRIIPFKELFYSQKKILFRFHKKLAKYKVPSFKLIIAIM